MRPHQHWNPFLKRGFDELLLRGAGRLASSANLDKPLQNWHLIALGRVCGCLSPIEDVSPPNGSAVLANVFAEAHRDDYDSVSALGGTFFAIPGLEGAKCICEPERCHLFRSKLNFEALRLSRILLSSRFACPHAALRKSPPASARRCPTRLQPWGSSAPALVEPCCQLCAAESCLHLKTREAEAAAHTPLLRRALSEWASCPR